jgi:hypothetical protein
MSKLQLHWRVSLSTSLLVLQSHRPLTLVHRLQYRECHDLDLTLFRFAGIGKRHQGPNSELFRRLESIRGELRDFLDAFTRKAHARFPGRFTDPHAIEFQKLAIDSTYYHTHEESLDNILFTIRGNLSLLEDTFRNAAGHHASSSIIDTLDLFCRHVLVIHTNPHLLWSYLTGKLSA